MTHSKEMYRKNELRIVLLGPTGVGKGAAGNTIFGEEVFDEGCSPQSQTQICTRHAREINGRRIVAVDMPGINLTSKKELSADIASSLLECAPGPHIFILVLGVTRHTRETQEAVHKMLEYFTDDVLSHTVLLFTRGDNLDEDMTIHDFISNFDDQGKKSRGRTLKDLAEKCGNRVHVIDNKHWNQNSKESALLDEIKKLNVSDETLLDISEKMRSSQSDETPWFNTLTDETDSVETECQYRSEEQKMREYRTNRFQLTQLMKSIKTILRDTNAEPYKNEALEEIGEAIKEEVNNIAQELKNEGKIRNKAEIDPRKLLEIRRQAIERVTTKLQRWCTGVATGMLLGVLLGVGVGVSAPAVLVAGLIRAGYRKVTRQRPETRETTVEKEVKQIAADANVVVGIGVWAIVFCAGIRALPIFPLCGAGFGLMRSYQVAKMSNNPNQALNKMFLVLRKKSLDILKACWNLGNTNTEDERTST